jgi:hypothetical protein
MTDGLYLIENDAYIVAMMAVVREVKILSIMADHNIFFAGARFNIIVSIPSRYT